MKLHNEYIIVFDALDEALTESDFEMKDWAEKSSIPAPRISELRAISRLYRIGKYNERTGRALTAHKINQLINGLSNLIGANNVQKKLKKALDKAKTTEEKLYLMFLINKLNDPEGLLKILEAILPKNGNLK
jgi:hypothetical protein